MTLLAASYSACVVYTTKTIIHLGVGESGGYLPPLRWIIVKYSPVFKTAHIAKKIWRIIKTIASIWGEDMLGYPWTLSVPQSSQFSLSYALGKLFAYRNRKCPQTNILAYFRTKWRLFTCIYSFDKKSCTYHDIPYLAISYRIKI